MPFFSRLRYRLRENLTSKRPKKCVYPHWHRPGSSVGIVTGYGLDSLGSNPSEDEIFHPSRPALGPAQSPVKWVPGLSQG